MTDLSSNLRLDLNYLSSNLSVGNRFDFFKYFILFSLFSVAIELQ